MSTISVRERSPVLWVYDYITGRVPLATDPSSILCERVRGVGVPGSRFEKPAGTGIRRSLVGSRGAPWTSAESGFPRHPGGVLTISSQDLVGSSCGAGGGKEMDPLSYVAGRRMGGAVAGIDRSFDSSELVAAFPVLHERVEIGLALRSDDHVAQRLVGGLAGLTSKLGDTEIGRCLVII